MPAKFEGKNASKIVAADASISSELEQIKGYLGPFMERLSTLSEEYETEKASLERAMFATLSDRSLAATQAIVEADFNKRTLVNIVTEYEQVYVHVALVQITTEPMVLCVADLMHCSECAHDCCRRDRSATKRREAFCNKIAQRYEQRIPSCRVKHA